MREDDKSLLSLVEGGDLDTPYHETVIEGTRTIQNDLQNSKKRFKYFLAVTIAFAGTTLGFHCFSKSNTGNIIKGSTAVFSALAVVAALREKTRTQHHSNCFNRLKNEVKQGFVTPWSCELAINRILDSNNTLDTLLRNRTI